MELTVTPYILPQTLKVEFSLRNTLGADAYVEQFYPTRIVPHPREGYVYVHRGGLLLVYFGTVPEPPRTCGYQKVRFYAELVPAGQTLQASLTMALPILEFGRSAVPDPTAPHEVVEVERLRVVICYRRKERGIKVREVPAQTGLYDVWGAESASVEATVPMPHPISAHRRTDEFDRPFEPADLSPG